MATIRAYLKGSAPVTTKNRFSERGGSTQEFYLGDLQVHRDGSGMFYSEVDDTVVSFSGDIEEVASHFSLRDTFLNSPRRMRGKYFPKKDSNMGVAILDHYDQRGERCILTVVGERLTTVIYLHRDIRAGTLMPTESWENEQTSGILGFFKKYKASFV